MTDFKVKGKKEYTLSREEKAISNTIHYLKKHRGLSILGILGIFIALYYTAGLVIGLFVALITVLVILAGIFIYNSIKWVVEAKPEKRERRVRILIIAGVGLFALYAVVKWVILPTEWGQTVSDFIWQKF